MVGCKGFSEIGKHTGQGLATFDEGIMRFARSYNNNSSGAVKLFKDLGDLPIIGTGVSQAISAFISTLNVAPYPKYHISH